MRPCSARDLASCDEDVEALLIASLDVRFVSIVSRLGPDTLYLIVSRARFINFRKLCISLYPDLLQIHCISVYPHVPAIVFNI